MPEPARIMNVYARAPTSLAGPWRVLIDPLDVGDGAGFQQDRRPDSPAELVEYGFADADTLEVPGDWNSQKERLFFYEGAVWYQRNVELEARPGRRAFLYFGAANYRASAWLDGEPLGQHAGGYTPFCFELPAGHAAGQHSLVVRVDNRHGPADVPTRRSDWWHYGGLTRDVLLVDLPETFISGWFLQLARGAHDELAGWVQLDGPERGQQVRLRIPELGIDLQLEPDASGRAELAVAAAPELWSPDRPRLYRVELSSASDDVADEIGFRSLETRGEDILLNGEPVFLCGISLHEESLLRPGRAHSPDDAEALLDRVAELGANFVRLAHYPHNEHIVRAAERRGFLVWAEIPLYWGIDWANPETLECARTQLAELIERDRNRACVALWSISNETAPGPERQAFLTSLVREARALDPTRLVTSALFGKTGDLLRALRAFVEAEARGEAPEPLTVSVDDPLADELDVVGWNEYMGWYYSAWIARQMELPEAEIRRIVLDRMGGFRIETPPGKPLIISEFGAGARFGRHGGELEIWSEEYQARVYTEQLAMLQNARALRGLSPWILKDFCTPLRLLPGVQDYWNRKGLLSERGEKKLAFGVLADFYRKKRATGT